MVRRAINENKSISHRRFLRKTASLLFANIFFDSRFSHVRSAVEKVVVLVAQKLHETKTNVDGSDQKMAIYKVRN
jgi:hypothetical protein